MRTGSLTQIVDIYRMTDRQSETGAFTKEKLIFARIRCALLRQQSSFGINANEEEDVVRLVFETWLDERIQDTDTLFWCNQE